MDEKCEVIIEQTVEEQCTKVEQKEFEEECTTKYQEECDIVEEYLCDQEVLAEAPITSYGAPQVIVWYKINNWLYIMCSRLMY